MRYQCKAFCLNPWTKVQVLYPLKFKWPSPDPNRQYHYPEEDIEKKGSRTLFDKKCQTIKPWEMGGGRFCHIPTVYPQVHTTSTSLQTTHR